MYTPNPINTENIVLNDELLALTEKLAANVHENWSAGRIAQGWTYGPVRDDAKKETPCLVPYDQLPESEKEYDRVTALESLKTIISLGYRIVKDEPDTSLVEDTEYDEFDTEKLKEELDKKFDELFGSLDDETEDYDDVDDIDALDNIIILSDENGNDVHFEFLDLIEYKGDEFVVLLPADDEDDSGEEVVILKIDSIGDDKENYSSVDDDEVLDAVFSIFKEKFKDEFNFVD